MQRLSLQLLITICFLLVSVLSVFAQADGAGNGAYSPARYGVALLGGAAYDPDHIDLVIIQGQMLLDYEQVVWHKAPDYLKMKFELNAGLTLDSKKRALVSVNMLALRYFRSYMKNDWVPYVEAGIGVIYTDFQVKEQGLRINFNPQAGVGFERPLDNGAALTIALRLHHLSNGGLHADNRGVNSALLQIGYLF
jgi:hypothetical protein